MVVVAAIIITLNVPTYRLAVTVVVTVAVSLFRLNILAYHSTDLSAMPVPDILPVESINTDGISQCGSARNVAGARVN